MTAGYSENGISGKTILAFILFIIDVALYFLMGHSVAQSHARHQEKYPQIPEGMHLTFSKDVDLKEYSGDTVHIPSGTVITHYAMRFDIINFYYSENKEYFEIFERLDSMDQLTRAEELGVHMLDAGFDCFAEQKQLEQIYEEAKNETKAMQSEAFRDSFTPIIIKGVILLAIGLFLTYAFSMLKWHIFLYATDIVGFFVIFFHMSSLICH